MTPPYVCMFDSTGDLVGRKRTYRAIKARVLEAGKFSVFEAANSMQDARLFMRLEKDPEVEIFKLPFPWCGVRRRNDQPAKIAEGPP